MILQYFTTKETDAIIQIKIRIFHMEFNGYLSLYRAMFTFVSSKPNRIFHSTDIIDKSFKIYEDMFELQQWTYELTLHQKVYEKPSAF